MGIIGKIREFFVGIPHEEYRGQIFVKPKWVRCYHCGNLVNLYALDNWRCTSCNYDVRRAAEEFERREREKEIRGAERREREAGAEKILEAERAERYPLKYPPPVPPMGEFLKRVEKGEMPSLKPKPINCLRCGLPFDRTLTTCPNCGNFNPLLSHEAAAEEAAVKQSKQIKEGLTILQKRAERETRKFTPLTERMPIPQLGPLVEMAEQKPPSRWTRATDRLGKVPYLGKAAGAMSPYTCHSCGAPLHKTITGKYICSNPNCPYSGIERKAEHIEKMHSSKISRSAIFMALGVIPLIFPGGTAGLVFMFGIWAMVLDLYFPHKPRGNKAAMFLKGFGKTISYLLFAFGFFLLNLIFPSLIILFLGYYSFPSGIADIEGYNIVQGGFKSIMAIIMAAFTFMFLGGPGDFKLVLTLLIVAFFFTIPSAVGEIVTLVIFVSASIVALFLGAGLLGAPPQSIIGLVLIVVSLLFYMFSKLGEKEKQQKEEREEKRKRKEEEEKQKKLELEEKELEEKEKEVSKRERKATLKIREKTLEELEKEETEEK